MYDEYKFDAQFLFDRTEDKSNEALNKAITAAGGQRKIASRETNCGSPRKKSSTASGKKKYSDGSDKIGKKQLSKSSPSKEKKQK
jgi:hypothetical protein